MLDQFCTKIVNELRAEREENIKRLSEFSSFHVTVKKIIFQNGEGNFFIIAVTSKKPKGEFITKTTFPFIAEGGIYDMNGEWVKDKKYGLQFKADTVSEARPDTAYGLTQYLASNIDGLGKKSAGLIVTTFGKDTEAVLNTTPERLYDVKGLRKKKIPRIIKSWKNHESVNKLYTFLSSIHVDAGCAKKIYEAYGNNSISRIKENPYCLTSIDGIGFLTADKVAKELGVKPDSPFRLRSGILYALSDSCYSHGNVYEKADGLIEASAKLLAVSNTENIKTEIDYLVDNENVVLEGDKLYPPKLYEAEINSAYAMVELMKTQVKKITVSDNLGKGSGIEYDEVQMEAIRKAMDSKVMVLTGGPGTGKTTTTKGIISAWKSAGLDILLAAPTGRAAKRLSEATGMDASTIHRLLGYKGKEGFTRNSEEPLEGDALIVDEASMIDIELLNYLLDAIPKKMRLVLVGDVDQLPSVGPGNVLRDIIESGVVPVVRLTRIFRQAATSRIITNAHLINEGKPIVYDNSPQSDFFFMQFDDKDETTGKIVDMVVNRLPNYYHVSPKDIQVLSPMRRSSNGVEFLNKQLQKAINPIGPEIQYGSTTFRKGDKVMQMKNDYDNDVFNGDIGFIVDVDTDENCMLVDFGKDTPIEYDKSMMDKLSLAYACTIHKSQGSEYPIVVMPFTTQFYVMLQRNLLYTGVTRAKKVCVLIGSKKAVSMAIKNGKTAKRNTTLKERLRNERERLRI